MLTHDPSFLVFPLIALVVGFCLGVLFLHEVQVWRYRRSLQPARRLKLPKPARVNRRRAELRVVR